MDKRITKSAGITIVILLVLSSFLGGYGMFLHHSKKQIIIKGAKEHNLQNIDLAIPRDEFIVITGLSGSGKASLAFDTKIMFKNIISIFKRDGAY